MNEAPEQPLAPAPPATRKNPFARALNAVSGSIRSYFLDEPLTFVSALVPLCFLSIALYTRHWRTNFIFDEQEALLANPYVRSVADPHSHLHWIDAFRRDFWGLPHDRTIGSYRPLPDLVWRFFWMLGARDQSPFLHHWVNVHLHGANGALMAVLAHKLTKDRLFAWLAGATFTATAVVTEAVSGVVGLADVLGTLGALLALLSITLAALGDAHRGVPLDARRPLLEGERALRRAARSLRVPLHRPDHAPGSAHAVATHAAVCARDRGRLRVLRGAASPHVSGHVAARSHLRGQHRQTVGDALLPCALALVRAADPTQGSLEQPAGRREPQAAHRGRPSRVRARPRRGARSRSGSPGDYSAPQEPMPKAVVFPESVIGAVALVGPIIAAPILGVFGIVRRKPLLAIAGVAMMWVVVSYFPVSNIPILLPTVRAERFWYFPAIGTSLLLTMGFVWALRASRARGKAWLGIAGVSLYLAWQSVAARAHANDYTDDLVFWDATRKAVPHSAKAHLNYSVMQGARGNLEERR